MQSDPSGLDRAPRDSNLTFYEMMALGKFMHGCCPWDAIQPMLLTKSGKKNPKDEQKKAQSRLRHHMAHLVHSDIMFYALSDYQAHVVNSEAGNSKVPSIPDPILVYSLTFV